MTHVLLTVSAYGPAVPVGVNRRRLNLFRGMAAASLRAQTVRDVEWIVLLDRDDPLRMERVRVAESAGLPCRFIYFDPTLPEDDQAETGPLIDPGKRARFLNEGPVADSWFRVFYRAGRLFNMALPDRPSLITRLDDDDAVTPDFLARIRAAATAEERVAWIFPEGFLIWPDGYRPYRHGTNMFVTHQNPPEGVHPFAISHNRVQHHLQVRFVDEQPAWAWLRHDDNLSKMRVRGELLPLDEKIRAMFPIDWGLL